MNSLTTFANVINNQFNLFKKNKDRLPVRLSSQIILGSLCRHYQLVLFDSITKEPAVGTGAAGYRKNTSTARGSYLSLHASVPSLKK